MSDAQKLLEQRNKRVEEACALKKPDRVPFVPMIGSIPFQLYGITAREVFEDFSRALPAWKAFLKDFPVDSLLCFTNILPTTSEVKKLLDYTLVQFPGIELPDTQSFQFVEKEYVKLEDYPEFLLDPCDWLVRRMVPQVAGNLKGLAKLGNPNTSIGRGYTTFFNGFVAPFANDEVWEAMQRLREAALLHVQAGKAIGQFYVEAREMGFDAFAQGAAVAPFDLFSDQLRGTVGTMKDMIRKPELLLKACQWAEDFQVDSIKAMVKNGAQRIFFPLHKGIDSFMSDAQFKKFYWPGLKKLLEVTAECGAIPAVLMEDSFDTRLEIMKDVAPGRIVYMCEKTDVALAKKVMGEYACIMGGVPISLLITSNPQTFKDHVKKVLDVAGRDGGFILSTTTNIDLCPEANVRALFEAAEEYCGQV